MTATFPTSTDALTPAGVRAARALVDISIGALAEISGVGSRTIARFEAGEAVPARATAARLLDAFSRIGVELIRPTSDRGAGAILLAPGGDVTFVRRGVVSGGAEIGLMARFEGRMTTARVETAALDAGGDVVAALAEFDRRRAEILRAVAAKLADGAIDADGHLRVRAEDIEAAEVDR